jgi:hypothetical protein
VKRDRHTLPLQGQLAAMFYTDDVQADYERMKARGAEFSMPPTAADRELPRSLYRLRRAWNPVRSCPARSIC